MLYVYRLLWPLRLGWLLVFFFCLYKEIYLQIFKCVSFWLHGCCGKWEGWARKPVNHTSWVAVVTERDVGENEFRVKTMISGRKQMGWCKGPLQLKFHFFNRKPWCSQTQQINRRRPRLYQNVLGDKKFNDDAKQVVESQTWYILITGMK